MAVRNDEEESQRLTRRVVGMPAAIQRRLTETIDVVREMLLQQTCRSKLQVHMQIPIEDGKIIGESRSPAYIANNLSPNTRGKEEEEQITTETRRPKIHFNQSVVQVVVL